jgi:hypothetical protein
MPAGVTWAVEKDKPTKKPKAEQPARKEIKKGEAAKPRAKTDLAAPQTCFGEGPKIASVKPDEAKLGEKLTITGTNLVLPGCTTMVSIGPGYPAKFDAKGDTQLTATVPSGGRKGIALLTVTTQSGEDSKPVLIK